MCVVRVELLRALLVFAMGAAVRSHVLALVVPSRGDVCLHVFYGRTRELQRERHSNLRMSGIIAPPPHVDTNPFLLCPVHPCSRGLLHYACGGIDASKTLISKRADLYRSKNELRAANSRLVKGLQVKEKRLNPRNTKVSV